jgi:hypothetical protein
MKSFKIWTSMINPRLRRITLYILGVEIGLLHAHSNDTTLVLRWLLQKLGLTKGSNKLLVWDMNMWISRSKEIIWEQGINLKNLETDNTYPYYFSESGESIITNTIKRLMKKSFLSHPDQIFINPGITVVDQQIRRPDETGLKSDHAMNHLIYRTTSQSLR